MPLTAAFSASPLTGNVPLTVTFTNQSTPASTITGYLWAFGDGYTATITSPVHSYTSVGYYTVTLAAMAGAEHNTITKTNYITVSATSAPTAAFTASPVTGTVPLTVTFTNQSSPTQTITSYLWKFGDGSTSTITNPEHTYTTTGYYTVALTAYAGAAQDTITKTNYITATSGGSAATLLTTTIGYTYDPLQRLMGAIASGATTYTFAYAYDAVGNRTVQTQTLTSTLITNYTYDVANRLTSVNGQAYTWDANGNLTNDGSKVYTYTQANRLITVTASGLSWSATYNGDGARLKQTVNSMDTSYTLDLATPLVQVLVQQDAGSKTAYLYGVRRVGEQQPSGWAYHLTDALGSVRQLADASAQVALARGYTPYGEPLWSEGSGVSVYGYTGEDWDSYIKLLFLRARYMQPTLGVFLSRDPWSGSDYRPVTQQGFLYADGNPVNLVDSSGMCTDGCKPGQTVYVQNSRIAGGLKLRTEPGGTVIKQMPDDTSLVIGNGDPRVDSDITWQYVTETSSGLQGWAAERQGTVEYLTERVPTPQKYPPPELASFGLGRLFKQRYYRVITRYGSANGDQSKTPLPDLIPPRKGHYGVDVIPVPDVPDDKCANDVVGREVLSPISGNIVDIYDPDGSTSPEGYNNPPGRSLDFANIAGYPDVKIQLSHVYPSRGKGPVWTGVTIGHYAQIGFSYGPHVHLTMRWKGSFINPEPYLPPPGWFTPE